MPGKIFATPYPWENVDYLESGSDLANSKKDDCRISRRKFATFYPWEDRRDLTRLKPEVPNSQKEHAKG